MSISIQEFIKGKNSFLSKEQEELICIQMECALLKKQQSKDESTKNVSGWNPIDSFKCVACTSTIIIIVTPILVNGWPADQVKKGLLAVVEALAEACGLSVKKVTNFIDSYTGNELVKKGAGWIADKLCDC